MNFALMNQDYFYVGMLILVHFTSFLWADLISLGGKKNMHVIKILS